MLGKKKTSRDGLKFGANKKRAIRWGRNLMARRVLGALPVSGGAET